MSELPSMTPEEMAWASQNAGRPAQARTATSEEFAARARAQDQQVLQQQHRQDTEYNQVVHAQDMAAAQAHHAALMKQYSVLGQLQSEAGPGGFGWKQGFVIGLAVGAIAVALLCGPGR